MSDRGCRGEANQLPVLRKSSDPGLISHKKKGQATAASPYLFPPLTEPHPAGPITRMEAQSV